MPFSRDFKWKALAAASTLLLATAAVLWLAGSRAEKTAQWSRDASTTYFLVASGGHVDLIRQSVRPASASTVSPPSITFSTATLDQIAGLRNGRRAAWTSIDRRRLPAQFLGLRWRTLHSTNRLRRRHVRSDL